MKNANEVISKELKFESLFLIVVKLIAYNKVARTIDRMCSQSPFNDAFLPVSTSAIIPTVPINVPSICLLVSLVFKQLIVN